MVTPKRWREMALVMIVLVRRLNRCACRPANRTESSDGMSQIKSGLAVTDKMQGRDWGFACSTLLATHWKSAMPTFIMLARLNSDV
jgi:hypothetical protein